MSDASATGVVEQMLDHAADQRWEALTDLLAEDFVIVEPASLPYGGEHHGLDGYVALLQRIGGLFELGFEPHGVHALDEQTVLLRMRVTFRERQSGAELALPVLELLTVREHRVARSEVFLQDPAALVRLLTMPMRATPT